MAEPALLVTEIERSAIHDGPGLRTVVFLQGCPLHCTWCCNPETQPAAPALLHDLKRCVGCGGCVPACPHGAVSLAGGKARVNRALCRGCGRCVPVCPTGANALSGRAVPLEQLLETVCRDRAYYEATGGGLTLSGGEPLAQPAAAEFLSMAKAAGLTTCVETTAFLPWPSLERALPHVDLFFVDYKHPDAGALLRSTGARLEVIRDNVRRLAEAGARVTLRTPVIPGFNDSEAALRGCFAFSQELGLERHVLLPYHSLGAGKYKKLGLTPPLEGVPVMKPEDLTVYAGLGKAYGLTIQIGG